ncbi:alanine--tRNA ligase [Candidatus Neomarinimicrobiota bacterium]
MNSNDIRQSFINFFIDKNHSVIRSSSVAPLDDPTLLFTNAGMNQFKPIFLNEQEPKNNPVVNSQKCIRVSGKHNDLEEVGIDTFHHTFFEMLGNWSFGRYYKAEAIKWAWELLTEVWKLDKNRLWATVYEDDDEAFELWKSETNIAHDRILRFGKKENFWEMGETGPCGPCSEIHYYIGEDLSKQSAKGVNATDEYWELWNLVFIQYNRDEKGKLWELPKKHVDTGAGLERIVSVIQGKVSNYETDLFQPLIKHIENITGISSKNNSVPHQVIADHVRMLTFSIADGVMPSNEGRGYIVRRILRRASRFGRILNQTKPFIYKLVDTVGDMLGSVYPEIIDKKAHIINVIKAEEKSFNNTLDRGLNHFDKVVRNMDGKIIPGTEAFKLYDTYGFPLDLTQLIAREQNLKVDEKGFLTAMKQQKKLAKSSGKFKASSDKIDWNVVRKGDESQFLGYESLESESKIVRWFRINDRIAIVLDKTPFYAESGGQITDTGTIIGDGMDLIVIDTQKEHDRFIHFCEGDFDESKVKNIVNCKVDAERRAAIKRNHTATHLLHAALKEVLGEHVHQAGSSVGPENFRFDLTHFEKITSRELAQVETIVNSRVMSSVKSFDDAKKEGAEALFGEKYGDEVRVITVGKFSKELCGGTHVSRTGDIGLFKIIEESSLAAGIRRIIAITGLEAVRYIQKQNEIITSLQNVLLSSRDELVERAEQIVAHRKDLEKSLKNRKFTQDFKAKMLVTSAQKVGNKALVISQVDASSVDELKNMGDELLSVMNSGVGVLGMEGESKPTVVVIVSPDLIKKGMHAGKIAKEIGAFMGGGGGGKPHLATAGGQDNAKLDEALTMAPEIIKKKLVELI